MHVCVHTQGGWRKKKNYNCSWAVDDNDDNSASDDGGDDRDCDDVCDDSAEENIITSLHFLCEIPMWDCECL